MRRRRASPRRRPVRLRCRGADRQPRTGATTSRRWSRRCPQDPKLAANWVMGELAAALNRDGLDIAASRCPPPRSRACSSASPMAPSPARSPRKCSRRCGRRGRMPTAVIGPRGLKQISDPPQSRRRSMRSWRRTGAAGRIPRRQGQAVRLLRRPGHEGHRRQGEPGAAQRAAEEEARELSAASSGGVLAHAGRPGPASSRAKRVASVREQRARALLEPGRSPPIAAMKW